MSHATESIAELEAARHSRTQRWEWYGERIGWAVVGVIIVAGLLGLLGPGPLSERTAAGDDGALTVRYDAFERYAAPCELALSIQGPVRDTVRVQISREFSDHTKIENVVPEPIEVAMTGDELVYTFRAVNPAAERLTIIYRYEHDKFGSRKFHVRVDEHSPVAVSQWVLP